MDKRSTDAPRFRFNADRHSAKRRVRYVESNHPGSGNCTLCELDELAQCEQTKQPAPKPNSDDSKLADQ